MTSIHLHVQVATLAGGLSFSDDTCTLTGWGDVVSGNYTNEYPKDLHEVHCVVSVFYWHLRCLSYPLDYKSANKSYSNF